jgi:hypothetical protein
LEHRLDGERNSIVDERNLYREGRGDPGQRFGGCLADRSGGQRLVDVAREFTPHAHDAARLTTSLPFAPVPGLAPMPAEREIVRTDINVSRQLHEVFARRGLDRKLLDRSATPAGSRLRRRQITHEQRAHQIVAGKRQDP